MNEATLSLDYAEVADGVIVRPMLTIPRAVDVFLAGGFEDTTRNTYSRVLYRFCDEFPNDWDVAKVNEDHCLVFLSARYRNRAPGTKAHAEAVLASFFGWLRSSQKIKVDPMANVQRTRRVPAVDLDVTTVSSTDVPRLLAAARPGSELNAVAVAVYLGPRRHALAQLRLGDYDQLHGRMRFHEKRGKTIWKPMPDQLRMILDASIDRGEIGPDGYLVPPEGPLYRKGERDDRVIWRLVKRVAARVGIDAHVHALRAAFAVFFLESNKYNAVALQELMGHESFETTRVYLRKLNKQNAMEPVRRLAWLDNDGAAGNPEFAEKMFQSSRGVGAGGFEPPFPESRGGKPAGTTHQEPPDAIESFSPENGGERADGPQ